MYVGKSLFIIYLVVCSVFAQDCGTQGEKCGDFKQCCGGCCINGVCTQETRDCTLVEDICEEMYCPPGYDCQVYQPPNCEGCESQRYCVTSQEK